MSETSGEPAGKSEAENSFGVDTEQAAFEGLLEEAEGLSKEELRRRIKLMLGIDAEGMVERVIDEIIRRAGATKGITAARCKEGVRLTLHGEERTDSIKGIGG